MCAPPRCRRRAAGRPSRAPDIASGPSSVAAAAAARGCRGHGHRPLAADGGDDPSPRARASSRARLPRRRRPATPRYRSGGLTPSSATSAWPFCAARECGSPHRASRQASGRHVALSWWDAPTLARVNSIFFDAMTEKRGGLAPERAERTAALPVCRRGRAARAPHDRRAQGRHRAHPGVDALPARPWTRGGRGAGQPRARLGRGPVPAPGDAAQIRTAFERLAEASRAEDGFAVPSVAKIAAGCRRRPPAPPQTISEHPRPFGTMDSC